MTAEEVLKEAVRLEGVAKEAQRQADLMIEQAMTCNKTVMVSLALGVDRNTIYNRIARLHGRPFGRSRKTKEPQPETE